MSGGSAVHPLPPPPPISSSPTRPGPHLCGKPRRTPPSSAPSYLTATAARPAREMSPPAGKGDWPAPANGSAPGRSPPHGAARGSPQRGSLEPYSLQGRLPQPSPPQRGSFSPRSPQSLSGLRDASLKPAPASPLPSSGVLSAAAECQRPAVPSPGRAGLPPQLAAPGRSALQPQPRCPGKEVAQGYAGLPLRSSGAPSPLPCSLQGLAPTSRRPALRQIVMAVLSCGQCRRHHRAFPREGSLFPSQALAEMELWLPTVCCLPMALLKACQGVAMARRTESPATCHIVVQDACFPAAA